jgi:hypothetical protein
MSPVAIQKKIKVKRENTVGSSTVMSKMKSYDAVLIASKPVKTGGAFCNVVTTVVTVVNLLGKRIYPCHDYMTNRFV